MIERHVYVKLLPEHADDGTLEALTRDALQDFPSYPGVQSIRVQHPADANAQHAWDLCLLVAFNTLEDYALYAEHPAHLDFIKHRLVPVSAARKAWNFKPA